MWADISRRRDFARWWKHVPALKSREFECQIIGNGPLEESLKEQTALLGVDRCVSITGPRTEGEIKRLLERSRMFVLACARADDGAMDNLPTVIMEAMAAGLPVVSTNVAAISEMIVERGNRIHRAREGLGALAQKMACLMDRSLTCARDGHEGARSVPRVVRFG